MSQCGVGTNRYLLRLGHLAWFAVSTNNEACGQELWKILSER